MNRYHNSDNTTYLGDITKWEEHKELIGKVDLIMGGSPCQDLSGANLKGEGLKGSRSGLFYTFLEMIKYYKPRYFFLENVASMTKENELIITELMNCKPYLIDSRLVSGMMGKRLYWTNIIFSPIIDDRLETKTIYNYVKKGICHKDKCNRIPAIYGKGIYLRDMIAANTPCKFFKLEKTNNGFYSDDIPTEIINKDIARTPLNSVSSKIVEIKNKYIIVNDAERLKGRMHDLKLNLDDGFYFISRFSNQEVEQLFGFPEDYTKFGKFANNEIKEISENARYKMLGNGWQVEIIKECFFKNLK